MLFKALYTGKRYKIIIIETLIKKFNETLLKGKRSNFVLLKELKLSCTLLNAYCKSRKDVGGLPSSSRHERIQNLFASMQRNHSFRFVK